MPRFPPDWDQEAKNGLTRLARMAIREAQRYPGEWVTRGPLEASVRYHPDRYHPDADTPGMFEFYGAAPVSTTKRTFYRMRHDAADFLAQMWGNEIYHGAVDSDYIQRLKLWDAMRVDE